MKINKLYIALLFSLISFFSIGQTHRFIYQIKFKENINKDFITDLVVTDVNKANVKSYSYDFLVYNSINKIKNDVFFANPKFEERFIKNLKNNKTINYTNFLESTYSFSSEDQMKWKLSNEFKEIGNFKVQKALCTFGGRK